MKSTLNNNLILCKHGGYQLQLTATNQIVLFHPGHPVCRTEFPELNERDEVVLPNWAWMPLSFREKVRLLLIRARSLPKGNPKYSTANPWGEPGVDYVKNWFDWVLNQPLEDDDEMEDEEKEAA